MFPKSSATIKLFESSLWEGDSCSVGLQVPSQDLNCNKLFNNRPIGLENSKCQRQNEGQRVLRIFYDFNPNYDLSFIFNLKAINTVYPVHSDCQMI